MQDHFIRVHWIRPLWFAIEVFQAVEELGEPRFHDVGIVTLGIPVFAADQPVISRGCSSGEES
jgi:hypothetical protein